MKIPRSPIFAWLSIIFPAISLSIAYLAYIFIKEPEGIHQLSGFHAAILFISLAFSLMGLVFSIVSMFLKERLRWLPIAGLLLNLFVVACFFANAD
jgi:hypothetical protein